MFTCQCQVFTINSKNGAYSTQDFIDCVWEGHLQIDHSYFELVNPFTRETFGKSLSILTAVKDSSRYFVVKIEQQGKQFFCGIGLLDRSDALELSQRMTNSISGGTQQNMTDKKVLTDLPTTDFSLKSNIVIKTTKKADNPATNEWVSFK